MKSITKTLKGAEFQFDIDYTHNSKLVQKKIGGFLFEFIVGYNKNVKHFIGSDYMNPEESSDNIEITSITEVCIYNYKNEIIELTDDEIHEIKGLIETRLKY